MSTRRPPALKSKSVPVPFEPNKKPSDFTPSQYYFAKNVKPGDVDTIGASIFK